MRPRRPDLHFDEQTTQMEVVRTWLREEESKPKQPEFDIHSNTEEFELEARLLAHKPGAARSLLTLEYCWIKCRIPIDTLAEIYTIFGSPRERPTVEEAASKFRDNKLGFDSESRRKVQELIASSGSDLGTFVVAFRQRPFARGSPYLLDGNHRALALYHRQIDGDSVKPQPAFLGFPGFCGHRTARLRRWIHQQLDLL